MSGWGVSDGVETAGRIGERWGGFCSRVLFPGYLVGRGLFAFALCGGTGGAGRLGVGGEVFWPEFRVEGGGRKNQQVIFAGAKLSRFLGVGEGQWVELGVAEHLLKGGVVEGAVYGRGQGFLGQLRFALGWLGWGPWELTAVGGRWALRGLRGVPVTGVLVGWPFG